MKKYESYDLTGLTPKESKAVYSKAVKTLNKYNAIKHRHNRRITKYETIVKMCLNISKRLLEAKKIKELYEPTDRKDSLLIVESFYNELKTLTSPC